MKWVVLTGVIVAAESFGATNRTILTLDDSSGATIDLTFIAPKALPNPSNDTLDTTTAISPATTATATNITQTLPERIAARKLAETTCDIVTLAIDIGSVVKVKGGLSIFRGELQIDLKYVRELGDTNAEVAAWKEAAKFRDEVWGKEWVLSAAEVERCRRDADGVSMRYGVRHREGTVKRVVDGGREKRVEAAEERKARKDRTETTEERKGGKARTESNEETKVRKTRTETAEERKIRKTRTETAEERMMRKTRAAQKVLEMEKRARRDVDGKAMDKNATSSSRSTVSSNKTGIAETSNYGLERQYRGQSLSRAAIRRAAEQYGASGVQRSTKAS